MRKLGPYVLWFVVGCGNADSDLNPALRDQAAAKQALTGAWVLDANPAVRVTLTKDGRVSFARHDDELLGSYISDGVRLQVRGPATEWLLRPFSEVLQLLTDPSPTRARMNNPSGGQYDEGLPPDDVVAGWFQCAGERVVTATYSRVDDSLYVSPWTFEGQVGAATLELGCVGSDGNVGTTSQFKVTLFQGKNSTTLNTTLTRWTGNVQSATISARTQGDLAHALTVSTRVDYDERTIFDLRPILSRVYGDRSGQYVKASN